MLQRLLILSVSLALTSCQAGSAGSAKPISAVILAEKYSVSAEAARREFDGKELMVKGYVTAAADMPDEDESEGLILLGKVECWFSRYESAEFAQIEGDRPITVKGVFNGESGAAALKFCKLVKVE